MSCTITCNHNLYTTYGVCSCSWRTGMHALITLICTSSVYNPCAVVHASQIKIGNIVSSNIFHIFCISTCLFHLHLHLHLHLRCTNQQEPEEHGGLRGCRATGGYKGKKRGNSKSSKMTDCFPPWAWTWSPCTHPFPSDSLIF
jgi:hypothetical protein